MSVHLLTCVGVVWFALASASFASEEDMLPFASFRFEATSGVVDFLRTFVEGQQDINGTITDLTIGFDGLSISVSEDVYSLIPPGAVIVQISGSLGRDSDGRTVTAYFFDRNTGQITRVAVVEDGLSYIY